MGTFQWKTKPALNRSLRCRLGLHKDIIGRREENLWWRKCKECGRQNYMRG